MVFFYQFMYKVKYIHYNFIILFYSYQTTISENDAILYYIIKKNKVSLSV
jgi:hypothetical protein